MFVEENDTIRDVNKAYHRDISTSLVGAFLDDTCLIAVVLWGNSGDGVTIVCPDEEDYADDVVAVIRKYL